MRWVDTGFALALDTASRDPFKFYLIYSYEVYDVEYVDGVEIRTEEPEQEEPPKFCEGPDGFTVAVLESPILKSPFLDGNILTEEQYANLLKFGQGNQIRLSVLSTKKPDLAQAAYQDADHPYAPIFSSRDN